jgi:hypothetical protein
MPKKSKLLPTTKTPRAQEMTNVIGVRGEHIFVLAITDYEQFQTPLFRPGFLGEKWPAVDFYVELLGVPAVQPFFFVQVKTTVAPLSAGDTQIKIVTEKKTCQKLYEIPVPTYIVGVHEPTKKAYILSLHDKPTKGVYSIPMQHELTPDNLKILHEEVREFWKASGKPTRSHFV